MASPCNCHPCHPTSTHPRPCRSTLAALAATSGVSSEREAFMELVEREIDRLEGQLEKRGASMLFARGSLQVGW